MNFLKAKKQLKSLAEGKYHTLTYSVSEYEHGGLTQTCNVYIDGISYIQGTTWEEALTKLKYQLTDVKVKVEPIKELPDV